MTTETANISGLYTKVVTIAYKCGCVISYVIRGEGLYAPYCPEHQDGIALATEEFQPVKSAA